MKYRSNITRNIHTPTSVSFVPVLSTYLRTCECIDPINFKISTISILIEFQYTCIDIHIKQFSFQSRQHFTGFIIHRTQRKPLSFTGLIIHRTQRKLLSFISCRVLKCFLLTQLICRRWCDLTRFNAILTTPRCHALGCTCTVKLSDQETWPMSPGFSVFIIRHVVLYCI